MLDPGVLGPQWFWHPLGECAGTAVAVVRCRSYNFWSGIAGSFLVSMLGWPIALSLLWYHHNCHIRGCWRLAWHPDPGTGHPLCKKHHPEDPGEVTPTALVADTQDNEHLNQQVVQLLEENTRLSRQVTKLTERMLSREEKA